MFEQTFKNVDYLIHKSYGCNSELDYIEQASCVLFLKYLDDIEMDNSIAAKLTGKKSNPIINMDYQCNALVFPKDFDRKIDHHKVLKGDDLSDFINIHFNLYLIKIMSDAVCVNNIEFKIGKIFSNLKNLITIEYNLSEVINLIDETFEYNSNSHLNIKTVN